MTSRPERGRAWSTRDARIRQPAVLSTHTSYQQVRYKTVGSRSLNAGSRRGMCPIRSRSDGSNVMGLSFISESAMPGAGYWAKQVQSSSIPSSASPASLRTGTDGSR
nr:hypothetical protein CFP56_01226 [Quercus suber]